MGARCVKRALDFAHKLLLLYAMAVVAHCKNFDASSAVVVQVDLLHCATVDDISIDGSVSSLWSVRLNPFIFPIPDE